MFVCVYVACWRSQAGNPVAGAAVSVRKHIVAAPLEGPGDGQVDQPGSIVDGWPMVGHLEFGMSGGLIVVFVYLECGIGIGVETNNWQNIVADWGKVAAFWAFIRRQRLECQWIGD